jgi:hypothetical protein
MLPAVRFRPQLSIPCTTTAAAVELTEEIAVVAISAAAVEFSKMGIAAVEDKDLGGVVVTVVVGIVELDSDTDDVIIADVVAVVSVEAIVVEASVEIADDVDDRDAEEDEDVIEVSGNRVDHVNKNPSKGTISFNFFFLLP